MPAASLGQDATLSFVVRGRGQKAGWVIRKLENWKISQTDELFTAYCAKRPEPACPACPGHSPGEPVEWVEGLTVLGVIYFFVGVRFLGNRAGSILPKL